MDNNKQTIPQEKPEENESVSNTDLEEAAKKIQEQVANELSKISDSNTAEE